MHLVTLIARTSTATTMMVRVSFYFVVLRSNRCACLIGLPILCTAMTGKPVLFRIGCILFTTTIHSSLLRQRLIQFIIWLIKAFSVIGSWKWPVLPQVDFFIRRSSNLQMSSILWGAASSLLML